MTSPGVTIGRSLRKRMTPQEVKLWNWHREAIAPTGFHFRRQVPIDRYVVDVACLNAKLVVEIDGEQHGLAFERARDEARDRRLSELGFLVLRFSNRQVDREKQVVLDTIYARLVERSDPENASRPDPSPPGEGGLGEAEPGGVDTPGGRVSRPTPVRRSASTRPSPLGAGSGSVGGDSDA